jgi:signal transduction histidine kinase
LLFLGRADGEAGLLEGESLELRQWIAGHLNDRAARGLSENVAFLRGPEDHPIWVRSHAPLLGQLLDNLLDNAAKYGRSDEPTIVELQQNGGAAALSVTDHGPGIAPEDLPRLFESFYRSDDARRLAQRIAHAFGGTITATSEQGHGSRFEVRLPLVERSGSSDRRNDDLALRM